MVTDLRNNRIVELRNSGITEGQGKSNIAPTFSKRGYNKEVAKLSKSLCGSLNVTTVMPHGLPLVVEPISLPFLFQE